MAVTDRIAVMREGTIAQFDTPERIHEAPADAFVASFIGGFCLLAGRASAGRFRPAATETELRTTSPHQGEGLLVIRPEDARDAALHPECRLNGRVASAAYHGRCWRLGVEIGATRIRLDWPSRVAPGDTLAFSLPPDRCRILAA
jgi:ABC-type Fe3+/spermidine/putrescine transport system ATPase subunit